MQAAILSASKEVKSISVRNFLCRGKHLFYPDLLPLDGEACSHQKPLMGNPSHHLLKYEAAQ